MNPIDEVSTLAMEQNGGRGVFPARQLMGSTNGVRRIHPNRTAVRHKHSRGQMAARRRQKALSELKGVPSNRVIEVGCGRGFNVRYLAECFKDLDFLGIDISEKNVRSAQKEFSGLRNATAVTGDFHRMDGVDESSTRLVFAVETICHATDLKQALEAISRVIQNGGKLIVFDGFRNITEAHSEQLVKAVQYTERAMAVPHFWNVEEFKTVASQCGLECEYVEDRSDEIMPNLIRLSDLAKAFFKLSMISRLILAVLPRGLVTNAVAGLLMAVTVQTGAHRYLKLSFRKVG